MEDLAYALTQVLHNFGAVAAAGGAAFALWAPAAPAAREARLVRLVGLAWAVQVASGGGFGVVSYLFHGRLPDLNGVAAAALATKVACAGLAIVALLQFRGESRVEARRRLVWRLLVALAAIALFAAAFLRWYS